VKRIVWLASYPKSGNTWFRAFVANLRSESERPVDINDFRLGMQAGARTPFDEIAGVEASDLTAEEIDRLRPGIYRKLAEEADEIECYKIHDAYTRTSDGRALIPPDATAGAIYFLRNPLDVAVSYAHHAHCDISQAITWMGDENHAMCANPARLYEQLRQRLLTWSGHVLSWVDQADVPVCVVRYEDMHVDTEATFTRAARFAGLPEDPARVSQAIRLSSFDELRRQEQEGGFVEKAPHAESFFRKGQVGAWRESLSHEQAARLIAEHGAVMQRFGYLGHAGQPVF